MKVLRKAWFWALIALLLLGASLWLRQRLLGPTIEVAKVAKREIVQKIVVSGRVLTPTRVNVGSLVSGVIEAVSAREGDHVAAGDLLVKIRDAELRAALAQAEAGLAVAEARLHQTRTVTTQVADQAHKQADTNLELSELSYQRTLALFQTGGVSQAELDEVKRARDIAQSQHDSSDAQRRALGRGGADHRAALAGVAQAAANVAVAKVRLDEATITAPARGVILARNIEPGDLVQAGRTLFVLAVDGETQLSIEPDEKNLPYLAIGQRARASADAFAKESFDAKVTYIAPAVDAQRGTIEVRLTVPSPPAYLRPDMTVSVDAEAGRHPDALVVPTSALHDVGSPSPWLFVVANGRLERREVKLGLRGDGAVELLSGASEGELVALLGVAELVAGARVRPIVKGE